MIVMVRRLVVPTPLAKGVPSWKSRSVRWQLAQETWPFELKRVSKNSFCPNAAAAGSSAYLLDGSAGRGGRLPIHRLRSEFISSSLHRFGRREEHETTSSPSPRNTNKKGK